MIYTPNPAKEPQKHLLLYPLVIFFLFGTGLKAETTVKRLQITTDETIHDGKPFKLNIQALDEEGSLVSLNRKVLLSFQTPNREPEKKEMSLKEGKGTIELSLTRGSMDYYAVTASFEDLKKNPDAPFTTYALRVQPVLPEAKPLEIKPATEKP